MHTNRRMDSRLHGNDGKKPPGRGKESRSPSFCHPRPLSVIPAKAGIHLRMARRGADAHQQTDGFPFARE